ncbi:inner centromere protein-like [Helianthus annuus]|uniref:inner centromere protein-like n=1 Tax=Helianthus annuus TaxID=4232 RepID=UPI001652F1A1|nr:inner centromere protein-like [Helianthus annuus]
MFEPDFKGQVDLIPVELREGFNLEIVGNFRVPKRDVLRAPVPEGEKAILADFGKFEKCIPKKHVEKKQVKKTARGRGKEKAEGSVVPPPVSQAAGSAAASGTAAGSRVVGKKREPEQKAAGGGELKRRKLQSKRTAPTQKKPAVAAEPEDAGYSLFDAPFSPSHTTAAGAGVPKEPAAPSVKVVPDPPVQVEETVENTAAQIFDTMDSSNNLISPTDGDGLDLRFSDTGKQKSDAEPRQTDAEPQKSSAGEKVTSSSSGGADYDGPPIQPGESKLEYYYCTYTQDRSRREEEAARLWAEAEELVKAARAGAEQLERERAAFDKQKQIAAWDATAELKQAANAALGKEKAAAEAIAVKAQQAEARAAEVQTREVAVTDLTARVSVAEERANVAVEARDALTSSLQQLEADREWMRSQGIAHVSIL